MKNLKIVTAIASIAICISCQGNTNKKQPMSLNTKDVLVVKQPVEIKKEPTVKVALLLDTSNSMDGLIDQAKAQLWEIVNELSYAKCNSQQPNLEIALYEYGNDGLPSAEGYIRQVLGFTSDLDDISEQLFALKTNGGSEHCGQVIQTALNQLDWKNTSNDLNLMFIAGNEPFTQGPVKYTNAALNAKENDVIVNTIFCGSYSNGVSGKWLEGATLAGGEFMTIDHNKEVIHIATPYDQQIIILNKQLNNTYIGYGNHGRSKKEKQMMQDANAMKMEEKVMVNRAVSKSSKMYSNKSWDLVDAEDDSDFSYESLDKSSLPDSLKNKSTEEIKAYVATKRIERDRITKEIQELNKKRLEYIAIEKRNTNQNETLDSAMIKAIKKQASEKNYSWE
ncbi:hypothetical protein KH5_11610 [Urechidicola sp. KH5]